jgi:hypothetical protein
MKNGFDPPILTLETGKEKVVRLTSLWWELIGHGA